MALNDTAVITAARGYIFTAAEGTTAPTVSEVNDFKPSTGLPSPWKNIGHTSRDELPEFGFDGGETETRGTWQNSALKTIVTETAVDYVSFQVLQWDEQALTLYYGTENSPDAKQGEFIVQGGSVGSIRKALAVIVVDGDVNVGFYAPKTDIRRDDAMTMAVDEFATMPLRATLLEYDNGTTTEMFRWISSDTGVNPGS